MTDSRLIYIASPYSHSDKNIRDKRYNDITKIVAQLIDEGFYVIPPITFNVPLSPYLKNPDTSWKYWKPFDELLISKCDEIWVVTLDGWKDSIGVRAEIKYAILRNIDVALLDPKTMILEFLDENAICRKLNINSIVELND